MSTHGFIILDFVFAFILSWLMLNFQLPSGRFALKKFENWLWDIKYHIERKKVDKFEFTYKNKMFSIRLEKFKPVDNFSYNTVEYQDIYINDELVCRLWSVDHTFSKHRWIETSNKRHSEEIFSIIKYAKKKANKIWSEDCSTRYKKESDDKSYFTTKDIDN